VLVRPTSPECSLSWPPVLWDPDRPFPPAYGLLRKQKNLRRLGRLRVLIDTPRRAVTMLPYRPVLEVRSLPAQGLLLFVGHHAILAWENTGQAWRSERLSSEGVTITGWKA